MNEDELVKQLYIDEGEIKEVYLDHLNFKSGGCGHLILKDEPEYHQPVGTPISEERVNEWFKKDLESVMLDCKLLYRDWNELPETAKLIICNMMFNMGRPRLSKFKGMKAGVDARDWNRAADEMLDSRWAKQVPNRANRLIERMRSIT
tara:strand:- start:883 stop:1326 length:444 start_codon:yes stop_codon:yes gene_type:complete